MFEKALGFILGAEGGFVNNPSDPGGATNLGITMATLQRAIELKLVPSGTVIETLTPVQAGIIYKAFYWAPLKCDNLPYPLCVYVFDAGVNQGVDAAAKLLQKALQVKQDGILGVKTMGVAAKATSWHAEHYMALRAMRYFGTRNFDKFGEGWLDRLFTLTTKVQNG